MLFALAVPAVVLAAVIAVELWALHKDHAKLQDIADAAALSAAGQMRVAANNPVLERAAAMAVGNADGLTAAMDPPEVVFLAADESGAPGGVEVRLTARRMSFFGNLLPPGGFVIRAAARAQQLGGTPLCVMTISTSSGKALDMPSGSVIARSCLVHSNKDIDLGGASLIDAAAVQAAGSIKGGSPANSGTGAPPLDDPLAAVFAGPGPGACQHNSGVKVKSDVQEVDPGVHCRHFDIEDGTLRFRPGVHHLKSGELQLKKGARIEGDNVTLVIWKDVKVKFDDGKVPLLDLSGSRGGAGEAARWAGFALAVDPARGGDLRLDFNEIRRLEGVVYAPATRLIVPGGINPTEVTPWTVVVARELRIEGGRQLQINADYAGSSVPVPNGVGNKSASSGAPVRLTH